MESSEPAPPVVLLDRASRATRGKRMTKLLDDEIQQDDLFWNQDALKDEEEDDNYVEEAEVADEFDSDFNDEPQTVKKKKEGEEKRMTQEEMLLEAAQTEIMNLRNLERVLAREEEVKRKAIVHKTVYNGPQIRYISKDGYTYLEFIKGSSFHSDIATTPVQYPEQPLCAITGLPAKYRDPKTGLPYATKEAFKEIRQRFAEENANNRKQMAMRILYANNWEHLWPRSYGLMADPALTDLHNIRSSDVNVNSSRGNKYYGECMTSSNKCLSPANKEAPLDTETDKQRWAPPARVRGDIARALMYMAVAYGFQQPGGYPGLCLSDTPNVENREMGLLSALLPHEVCISCLATP